MKAQKEEIKKFLSGQKYDAYKFFGCHLDGNSAIFRVWAPHAKQVCVMGDFNEWQDDLHPMTNIDGIWQLEISDVNEYCGYKYCITTKEDKKIYKSDPYAFHSEIKTSTNSKAVKLNNYTFNDTDYIKNRTSLFNKPVNIYEVHIGSWRKYDDGNHFCYRKFAEEIVPYLVYMNYTHVELMGIAEYPYDGSWGYQVTGYYAPTSRYGKPEDFAYLVDRLHSVGIGVILDWVPAHFPKDANGLYEFDGESLYEPKDKRMSEHKDWGTCTFDYGSGGVKSFLISNALYWLREYHIDGLRVDAVASMLCLDYARGNNFTPNKFGGRENLDAVDFFKELNTQIYKEFPHTLMIAEDSTAWPLVTKPVSDGGLGFNYKWNMGWMNDTLSYACSDPYFRGGIHNKMTFSMSYAFAENYVLPISHDEVVHGKASLVNKMPGTYEQKFAGFRNYLMAMYSHPGKKLLFMGSEFAQFIEWNYEQELDWFLLEYPSHKGSQEFVKALNDIYLHFKPLWEIEDSWDGFEWLVVDDKTQNVFVYERKDKQGNRFLVVLNYSGLDYKDYSFGINDGSFTEVLSSDVKGFNINSKKIYKTKKIASHGKNSSLTMDIPAFGGIYMVGRPSVKKDTKSKHNIKIDIKDDTKNDESNSFINSNQNTQTTTKVKKISKDNLTSSTNKEKKTIKKS